MHTPGSVRVSGPVSVSLITGLKCCVVQNFVSCHVRFTTHLCARVRRCDVERAPHTACRSHHPLNCSDQCTTDWLSIHLLLSHAHQLSIFTSFVHSAHGPTSLTALLEEIGKARSTLDICVFTITCNEIASEIKAAKVSV